MAFIAGEIVPDAKGTGACRVVFKVGADTIAEWTVYSEILAKAQIIEGLQWMRSRYDEGPAR